MVTIFIGYIGFRTMRPEYICKKMISTRVPPIVLVINDVEFDGLGKVTVATSHWIIAFATLNCQLGNTYLDDRDICNGRTL